MINSLLRNRETFAGNESTRIYRSIPCEITEVIEKRTSHYPFPYNYITTESELGKQVVRLPATYNFEKKILENFEITNLRDLRKQEAKLIIGKNSMNILSAEYDPERRLADIKVTRRGMKLDGITLPKELCKRVCPITLLTQISNKINLTGINPDNVRIDSRGPTTYTYIIRNGEITSLGTFGDYSLQ